MLVRLMLKDSKNVDELEVVEYGIDVEGGILSCRSLFPRGEAVAIGESGAYLYFGMVWFVGGFPSNNPNQELNDKEKNSIQKK